MKPRKQLEAALKRKVIYMQIPIIIDKIEDGLATLAMTVPEAILPENAREGDVLFYGEDGRLQIDADQTRIRRNNTLELFNGLLDKD